MKNYYVKTALAIFLFGVSPALFSQNVAINTSGNSAYTSAILDLSNQNTVGTVGFLPPYVTLANTSSFQLSGTSSQSNGIMVYNTGFNINVPAGLYYWNNTLSAWIAMGGASSLSGSGTANYLARWTSASILGTGVAQDNGTGVSISSTALTPANKLDVNGSEAIGTYAGRSAPANGLIVSGQVGIGNNSPASSSIIDFTNTKAAGSTGAPIVWPTNPSPSVNITPPVLGEEIYNTTTGCFNFYNGTAWVVNGCPCTVAPGTPTITASCSESFQGSSITYTSSISTGVTFSWTVTATTGVPTVTGNGTSSITVTWPSGGAGTGTVTLNLANMCGTSTATQSVIINANPTITGASTIYVSTSGNMFNCSVSGATYSWSSNNTSEGNIVGSTTGQSVSITAGASSGTFTLTCNVSFGACSQTITYAVTVSACANLSATTPVTPSNNSCSGVNIILTGIGTVQYSTTAIAGATSYNWSSSNTSVFTVPASTATPTVTINAVAPGTANLTVQAVDGCSSSLVSAAVAITIVATTQTVVATGVTNITVPCGVTTATVYLWGGGGGGGGGGPTDGADWQNGGGGGGGACGVATISGLTAGNVYTVTVGAGGTAGAGTPTAGGTGGTTTFTGALGSWTAAGGTGGTAQPNTATTATALGGAGASTGSGTGIVIYSGGNGSTGYNDPGYSGSGGGGAGSSANGTTPVSGSCPGAGGLGGTGTYPGGNGGYNTDCNIAGNLAGGAGTQPGGGGAGDIDWTTGTAGGAGGAGEFIIIW